MEKAFLFFGFAVWCGRPQSCGVGKRRKNNLESMGERRREQRKHLTPAEAKLWTKLSRKQFHGYSWRRQFSVENYILDFYCPSGKLAVELDGQVHLDPAVAMHDVQRTLRLNELGIRVLRFENRRVFEDWENMEECILAALENRSPRLDGAEESKFFDEFAIEEFKKGRRNFSG